MCLYEEKYVQFSFTKVTSPFVYLLLHFVYVYVFTPQAHLS